MVCWEFALSLLAPMYLGGYDKQGIHVTGIIKNNDKNNETLKQEPHVLSAKALE